MDPFLNELIDNDTPKLNPLLANGLAVEHMKFAEKYIDEVWRSTAKGFPEGFTYKGYERYFPDEELRKITARKIAAKAVFDTARSDVYLVRYLFDNKGEQIVVPLYLPFVGEAGSIHISGSQFVISPILSDRVISVGINDIFIRILKARLTFKRMTQFFMVNGVRETVPVIWSDIHNERRAKPGRPRAAIPSIKANCTMMHYLMCKYGFHQTFKKFGHCKPIIGTKETINYANYDPEEWALCSTATLVRKPRGVPGFWLPSNIVIAVKKEEFTPMVKFMICDFFYIADRFPSRITPEYIDHKGNWRILLGHLIFGSSEGDGVLQAKIDDHVSSLDEYIDTITQKKMKEILLEVDDIYQLIGLLIEKFNEWLQANAGNISSMYNKELSILYYVLFDITNAINNMAFRLKAISKTDTGKKELQTKDIENTMKLMIKQGVIFHITRRHGEISTITTSGDNKAFRITSTLVAQSDSKKLGRRGDRSASTDPAKRLHVSIIDVGCFNNQPKSAPDGRQKLNHHCHVDENSVVQRNPKYVELLNEIQEIIQR